MKDKCSHCPYGSDEIPECDDCLLEEKDDKNQVYFTFKIDKPVRSKCLLFGNIPLEKKIKGKK